MKTKVAWYWYSTSGRELCSSWSLHIQPAAESGVESGGLLPHQASKRKACSGESEFDFCSPRTNACGAGTLGSWSIEFVALDSDKLTSASLV